MPLISNLSGMAGSHYAPLQPSRAKPIEHIHGPFAAELFPSILTRASGTYPSSLTLGLLTTRPDPDGACGAELNYPGYQRQTVELISRNTSHLVVPRPVLFDIFDCPAVTSLALFNAEGRVVAHGAMRGRTTEKMPPWRFEFASHQIMVRRSQLEA